MREISGGVCLLLNLTADVPSERQCYRKDLFSLKLSFSVVYPFLLGETNVVPGFVLIAKYLLRSTRSIICVK